MALKYYSEYRTLNTNELWRIEIDIPGYVGSPIEKYAVAEQACIIEHEGGDKLWDRFAVSSSATVVLLFDDDAQTKELQLLADKTAKLTVFRNGGSQLYWKGYIISDGIQHPDSGVSTPISIKAVDMVEASGDMVFVNSEAEAVTVDGVVGAVNSPLNWIRKCLIPTENIANPLPIRWSSSLKNLQYPTDDFFGGRTGFIPNYDVFASSREKTTVLWMLENIVKSVGCTVFQYGGYWYIVSLVDIARSSTLDFYQIDGSDLTAKTATTVTINLSKALPQKLNESTFTMVQKPISKVKSSYNHSMPANIIPNGSFDILNGDGKPLYWAGDTSNVVVTANDPINSRASGKAMRAKNNSLIATGSASYQGTLPFDADVLFKDMQWGFTFLPISGFGTNTDGTIDWSSSPLNARVLYTGYDELGNVYTLHLNEFGYWQNSSQADAFKIISVEKPNPLTTKVTFSGTSYLGQTYTRQWGSNFESINFDGQRSLADTLNYISLNDGMNPAVSGNSLIYATGIGVPNFNVAVTEYNSFTASFIPFQVDGLKPNDIATIQFQSKGNQGRVLMPFPGKLDVLEKPLLAGKLTLELILKQGQEIVFDDVYMNISDNTEFWEISDDGNDGLAEYELEISSSFSGFMTSSYMNGYSTADLSQLMNNGIDRGTLTEIFGKTALRMLSMPTEKIDTELEGEVGMLSLLSYRGTQFIPLKTSVNTETNSSSLTIVELNYDDELVLESVHKSTGDGESSGFSSGGYGGGGSNPGDNLFLTDLKDVTLTTPQQGDLLMFDSATGKWVNSDNFYNKTQSDARFQPLENQRLSTSNNVVFNGVRGSDYVAIPSTSTAVTGIGYTIWVDELGSGGGATPPPIIVNLTDLQDVSISSPTNGQALVYNASTGKWMNASVAVNTPTLQRVLEEGNTSNLGATFGGDLQVPNITLGFSGQTNYIGSREINQNLVLRASKDFSIETYDNGWLDRFIVFQNGDIAIGKNIAGAKLDVNGSILALPNVNNPNAVTVNSQLSNYATTNLIPTNNNQLINGSGYITSASLPDLSPYAKTDATNINVANYKTALGLPSTGGYDFQAVMSRGSSWMSSSAYGTVELKGAIEQGGNGIRLFGGNTPYAEIYGEYQSQGVGQMFFRTYSSGISTNVITITGSNGSVGIGVNSPSEKLHVNGNVLAQGVKATTKLETRGVTSGGTASGNFYDLYIQE